MNGVHDVGGMHGMGPIEREADEPVFHAHWEAHVYAMNRALGRWRKWNLDTSRWVGEQFAPADYFRMSYYERWYSGLIKLLVDNQMVSAAEMKSGKPAKGSRKLTPPLRADQVVPLFRKIELARPHGFKLGNACARATESAPAPGTTPKEPASQKISAVSTETHSSKHGWAAA